MPIFIKDNKGKTIQSLIKEINTIIDNNPQTDMAYVLAGGSIGIQAATNEVVSNAQVPIIFSAYSATFILCLLLFRSIIVALCIIIPLSFVSVLCYALMDYAGLK
jgi:predicted RND superfamily exporter protein